MKLRNMLAMAGLALLFGCAMVTVNVYFPEEDVKMAYDMMEDEFMHQTAEAPEDTEGADLDSRAAADDAVPVALAWSLVSPAEADETVDRHPSSEDLVDKLREMDEVVAAYQSRAVRNNIIEEMLNGAVIGITNDGLVALLPRENRNPETDDLLFALVADGNPDIDLDELTPEYLQGWATRQIAGERRDRKVIIQGMAEAMVALVAEEKQEIEDEEALLRTMMVRAAQMFSDREMSRAAYGWWLQRLNGSWEQKHPPVIEVDENGDTVAEGDRGELAE